MIWNKKLNEDTVKTVEWRTYKDKTDEELEKEVDTAYSIHSALTFIRNIVILGIAIFLLKDIFIYVGNFVLPHAPSQVLSDSKAVISVEGPVLEDLDPEDNGTYVYKTLESGDNVDLRKVAKCSITGKEVVKSYLFISSYFPWHKENKMMDKAALCDVGLVWGDLAKQENMKSYNFVAGKDVKSRYITPKLKSGVKEPPIPWTKMGGSMSHVQVLPANANVMHALISSKKHQPLKMDGYLVNVYYADKCLAANNINQTFDGRDIRKGSDKKIMLVERVQIGNKIYE